MTELLQRWSRGDRGALDQLFPLVYEELRKIAARQLRHEQDGQSVDPTDLSTTPVPGWRRSVARRR